MGGEQYRMLVIGLSRKRGGVESYILNMLRGFSRKRLQCYFPANGAEETYGEELTAMGHRFIKAPAGRGWHFINYYREWNRIFREYRFDAVYLNDCYIVQIDPLRFALKYHVPVRIFHAHNSAWMGEGPSLRARLMAAWNKCHISSFATRMLGCSRESAEWMFPRHSPYAVIFNAVDIQKNAYSTTARSCIRNEFSVGSNPLVGYIGRFDPEKNPTYFVHVFAALRRLFPEAVALMVGDGCLRDEVEAAIRNEGLPEGSIRLLGVRHDVSDIMSALDCLVMPSLVEGFPYVLVEAQAHGLPCIVSDRVVQDTNLTGLLRFVPLEAPTCWVEAIAQVLQNESERSGYALKLQELGYDSRVVFADLENDIINGIENARA